MMHAHAELITRFYDAFAAKDGEAMAACYHDDVRFSDPVFPELRGSDAGDMWRMLTSRATDLELEVSNITGDDARGGAHWEARYTFSATGRKVHNVIDASFRFKDGLIVEHVDDFDFYRWSRMALGPAGVLLGWTPIVRNKVRAQAGEQLRDFIAKRGA
ncbi:MAG: nuclear transport factor 2 family protein [Myxococcales bacterium]|nr:nuclear transport factor 2 family protein [Myxococcales bacterium]